MDHLDHLDHPVPLLLVIQVNQVTLECQVDQDLLERLVTLLDHLGNPDPVVRTANQVNPDPKDLLAMKAHPDRMVRQVLQVILVRTADLEKRELAAVKMDPMDPKDQPGTPADPELMDALVGFSININYSN